MTSHFRKDIHYCQFAGSWCSIIVRDTAKCAGERSRKHYGFFRSALVDRFRSDHMPTSGTTPQPNDGSMLGRRLRRCNKNKPTYGVSEKPVTNAGLMTCQRRRCWYVIKTAFARERISGNPGEIRCFFVLGRQIPMTDERSCFIRPSTEEIQPLQHF